VLSIRPADRQTLRTGTIMLLCSMFVIILVPRVTVASDVPRCTVEYDQCVGLAMTTILCDARTNRTDEDHPLWIIVFIQTLARAGSTDADTGLPLPWTADCCGPFVARSPSSRAVAWRALGAHLIVLGSV